LVAIVSLADCRALKGKGGSAKVVLDIIEALTILVMTLLLLPIVALVYVLKNLIN